jgi:hypothetical protein
MPTADGHAFGARRAVDEYFAEPSKRLLLNRVNFTNRLAVKPQEQDTYKPPPIS